MNATDVFVPWLDADAKPMIEFSGVTKNYGDFTAIDNIDLKIFPREFFALLGPSGCGKTTMMRMLGGFENVTKGTITIDGQDMKGVPANKRAVNMMFQSYALFPHLSVADNLAFGLKRSEMPKSEIKGRVDEMLRLVQLGKFASRKPHQLSGGQRQRVALARALAKAPKLLLLDEPLGALDKKLRQETQFELMDIQEKTGTTFVIVTHDQEEAMTMASRIAVMDHGKLVQVDTPDRIYEAPNSVYVADFIGDVNIIEGRIAKADGEAAELAWAEGHSPIRGMSGAGVSSGQGGAFAIRPEKIVIGTEEPTDVHNRISGEVEDIAYLGNISTYYVRLENGALVKSQTANTRRIARRGITWNDKVWLSWTDTAGIVLAG
ncbi:Spermidine/putrescine import ATP-binding protein PotA [Tritonibacter multivorans]|uniref:Spermidine/putrescine import ATP-binding protein PotA n=1 Tax=Tritonibacter multivorans TaxID=928856 RepID=A0A0P1FZ86_9RHOB|nr:ABC transporter ATP-binding protein [Tritonibacter multivorans]MDA7422171.1 ABC transporter ATP-binding protein [Tritonibacter multivorans]CUH74731.1 Spermidine/putrescine import ATP-binding protein PotA [Tritonibacter multivorans]SFD69877.1 putrescine transport system ATP-binding protein [Tritonibacter multivorans]